jgi:hypothetical protein
LDVPNLRRARISWAEFEAPSAERRALVSWSELETPTSPARCKISWAEFQVPSDVTEEFAETEKWFKLRGKIRQG